MNDEKDSRNPVREFPLAIPSTVPVPVRHLDVPPPHERRQRIYSRRVLPRVKEGRERAFRSNTDSVVFYPARSLAAVRAATDDLALVTNIPLPQPGQQPLASSVGEPSVSINGQVVLFTGNWYATRSVDAGQTLQFIDSFTSFPNPPNLSFCCDQVVSYIASIDTFVWLLYSSDTLRSGLAFVHELRGQPWRAAAGAGRLLRDEFFKRAEFQANLTASLNSSSSSAAASRRR